MMDVDAACFDNGQASFPDDMMRSRDTRSGSNSDRGYEGSDTAAPLTLDQESPEPDEESPLIVETEKAHTKATHESNSLSFQDGGLFCCNICTRRFVAKTSILAHAKAHCTENPHVCQLCGWCFPLQAELSVHLRTIHRTEGLTPNYEQKPLLCSTCHATFPTVSKVYTHIQQAHPREPSTSTEPHHESEAVDQRPSMLPLKKRPGLAEHKTEAQREITSSGRDTAFLGKKSFIQRHKKGVRMAASSLSPEDRQRLEASESDDPDTENETPATPPSDDSAAEPVTKRKRKSDLRESEGSSEMSGTKRKGHRISVGKLEERICPFCKFVVSEQRHLGRHIRTVHRNLVEAAQNDQESPPAESGEEAVAEPVLPAKRKKRGVSRNVSVSSSPKKNGDVKANKFTGKKASPVREVNTSEQTASSSKKVVVVRESTFKCPSCPRIFLRLASRTKHITLHHGKASQEKMYPDNETKLNSIGVLLYRCVPCGTRFDSRTTLADHKKKEPFCFESNPDWVRKSEESSATISSPKANGKGPRLTTKKAKVHLRKIRKRPVEKEPVGPRVSSRATKANRASLVGVNLTGALKKTSEKGVEELKAKKTADSSTPIQKKKVNEATSVHPETPPSASSDRPSRQSAQGVRNVIDKVLGKPRQNQEPHTPPKSHSVSTNSNAGLKCQICSDTFPTVGALARHRKAAHSNGAGFQCPLCPTLNFSTASALVLHQNSCHATSSPIATNSSPSALVLGTPEKKEATPKLKNRQRRNSQPDIQEANTSSAETVAKGKYACEYCSKSFTQADAFFLHRRIHTQYKDSTPERVSPTENAYRKHLVNVDMQSEAKMKETKKIREKFNIKETEPRVQLRPLTRTPQGFEVNVEKKKVTKKSKYKFKVAEEDVEESSIFKGVELSDSNESMSDTQSPQPGPSNVKTKRIATISCEICEHQFKTKDAYNIHKKRKQGLCGRKHTALSTAERTLTEKPWLCSKCPRRFTFKGHLVVHMKLHDPANLDNQNHRVCQCGQVFATSTSLYKHQRTEHGIVTPLRKMGRPPKDQSSDEDEMPTLSEPENPPSSTPLSKPPTLISISDALSSSAEDTDDATKVVAKKSAPQKTDESPFRWLSNAEDQQKSSDGDSRARRHYRARCDWCDINFMQEADYKTHHLEKHPGRKMYVCATCGEDTSCSLWLFHHKKQVHGITTTSRPR